MTKIFSEKNLYLLNPAEKRNNLPTGFNIVKGVIQPISPESVDRSDSDNPDWIPALVPVRKTLLGINEWKPITWETPTASTNTVNLPITPELVAGPDESTEVINNAVAHTVLFTSAGKFIEHSYQRGTDFATLSFMRDTENPSHFKKVSSQEIFTVKRPDELLGGGESLSGDFEPLKSTDSVVIRYTLLNNSMADLHIAIPFSLPTSPDVATYFERFLGGTRMANIFNHFVFRLPQDHMRKLMTEFANDPTTIKKYLAEVFKAGLPDRDMDYRVNHTLINPIKLYIASQTWDYHNERSQNPVTIHINKHPRFTGNYPYIQLINRFGNFFFMENTDTGVHVKKVVSNYTVPTQTPQYEASDLARVVRHIETIGAQ